MKTRDYRYACYLLYVLHLNHLNLNHMFDMFGICMHNDICMNAGMHVWMYSCMHVHLHCIMYIMYIYYIYE